MAYSVLLVEDDAFTRTTVEAALKQIGFEVPAPASNAAEALVSFNEFNQDVLLVDLDLGTGPSGIDLASLLRSKQPNLGVIFLTSYSDPRLHRKSEAWLPGGSQYLVKQSLVGLSDLGQAINSSIQMASKYESKLNNPSLPSFTSVQITTMQLLAAGLSNSEIARQRNVTEKAVEKSISLISSQLALAPDSATNQRVSIARAYSKFTGGKL